MKILHTEASLGWGGQEIRILREALGMRQRGHEIIIAADPKSSLLENAHNQGFMTIPVAFKRRNLLPLVLYFKRQIEKEKIDIVNTHSSKDSWLVLPAARLAGNKPLAIRTRHLSTPIGKTFLSRLLYNSFPHMVITTGEAIRLQMITVNRFDPHKIISIPTGVDAERFTPDAPYTDIRQELGLAASTVLVGSVSVIRSWKGLDYFVRAIPIIARVMPEVRFVIAGDGPHRNSLERTIEETGAGDRIFLLGHREDIVDILKSIDILIHPSYANEGVPQTVLQAMAMKKPVVASDIPPLKEVVIENVTGLLTRIKDPESIASAVLNLLHDKESSRRFGENGRRLVETSYSFAGMLDKIESLYRGVNAIA
ncbi:MAG: glycosyltransferase family 4 protein [Nitrospirota bacterium]|nr:glycosyltransferase family 4 protein [Nitrospirota bacterium]